MRVYVSVCVFWTCLHKGRAAVTQWGQESPWESVWGPGAHRSPHRAGPARSWGWCWDSRCTGGQAGRTRGPHASGRWKLWWFDLDGKHEKTLSCSNRCHEYTVMILGWFCQRLCPNLLWPMVACSSTALHKFKNKKFSSPRTFSLFFINHRKAIYFHSLNIVSWENKQEGY